MTGPFETNAGPSLYMFANMDFDAGTVSYRNVMFGYYCNTDMNNIRTSCFPEFYNIVPNPPNGVCPSGFAPSKLLDPLYHFAYDGTEHSSDCKTPFPIAIVILGITTGIFLCSTIYLVWRKYRQKYLEELEDTTTVHK